MASTINASTASGGGVITTADASGVLQLQTAGTTAVTVDASQNVLVTGGGGLGYGTGSGGTVTQLTSKATAVTLNKATGRIITAADALGAGGVVNFTINNTLITQLDNIVINLNTINTYTYSAYSIRALVVAGSIFVSIKNESAGSLSEAISFQFSIIKGATS